MKFGKHYRMEVTAKFPAWEAKCLAYKLLKQHLKHLRPHAELGDEEKDQQLQLFSNLLMADLEKLSVFFFEKEEEYVMRMQVLKNNVDLALSTPIIGPHANVLALQTMMLHLGQQLAKLHGEMVLFGQYNLLNFTGLRKIIKKHGKKIDSHPQSNLMSKVMREAMFAIGSSCLLSKLSYESHSLCLKCLTFVGSLPNLEFED